VSNLAASSGVIRAGLKPLPPLVRSFPFTSFRSMSTIVGNGMPVTELTVRTSWAGLAIAHHSE
jgi:hypothetical protein